MCSRFCCNGPAGVVPFVLPEVRVFDTSCFHSQQDLLKVPVFGEIHKRQTLRLHITNFFMGTDPFHRLSGLATGGEHLSQRSVFGFKPSSRRPLPENMRRQIGNAGPHKERLDRNLESQVFLYGRFQFHCHQRINAHCIQEGRAHPPWRTKSSEAPPPFLRWKTGWHGCAPTHFPSPG